MIVRSQIRARKFATTSEILSLAKAAAFADP